MKYQGLIVTLKTTIIETKKTIETQIAMSQKERKIKSKMRENRSRGKNRDRNRDKKERIKITLGNRRTQR